MLPDETSEQYEAFECYLNIKPAKARSIRRAWEIYAERAGLKEGSDPSVKFKEWSRRHDWRGRARAYDAHLAEVRRAAAEDGIRREAKAKAIDVERMLAEAGEFIELYGSTIRSAFLEAIDDEAATPASRNQAMRIYVDMLRLMRESTGMASEEDDPFGLVDEEEYAQKLLGEFRGRGAQEGP